VINVDQAKDERAKDMKAKDMNQWHAQLDSHVDQADQQGGGALGTRIALSEHRARFDPEEEPFCDDLGAEVDEDQGEEEELGEKHEEGVQLGAEESAHLGRGNDKINF
jgi:hypothetical protein